MKVTRPQLLALCRRFDDEIEDVQGDTDEGFSITAVKRILREFLHSLENTDAAVVDAAEKADADLRREQKGGSAMRITAKDGLLWHAGKVIPLPYADTVAHRAGYAHAEQFVAVLGKGLPDGQYYSLQTDGHQMLCNADGTRSIFDDVDE